MARLARENELSTTKIYSISDYSSSLSAKCVDFTYLSELSITSTATTAYVYTGSASSSKIAIYKQFKAQPLTASSWNIDCDVYFGEASNGAACEIVIAGSDMGYNQMIGKYFVPGSIAGSSYYGDQSTYVNEYRNKLLVTTAIRGDFTITNAVSAPYGTFHAAGNTGAASSYIGTRIGSVATTQKYCHISGTSKTQGIFYHLYNESGLNYNNQKNGIAFGDYSTGSFNLNQIYNMYGYVYLVWLNSGSKMNAGPGLYFRLLSDATEVYIKARVENRRYNGSIVYLTGKIYMPVHVIATSTT